MEHFPQTKRSWQELTRAINLHITSFKSVWFYLQFITKLLEGNHGNIFDPCKTVKNHLVECVGSN